MNSRKLEHRFRMIHAGIPFTLLYFKGMRLMMFQLSGFDSRLLVLGVFRLIGLGFRV